MSYCIIVHYVIENIILCGVESVLCYAVSYYTPLVQDAVAVRLHALEASAIVFQNAVVLVATLTNDKYHFV